MNKKILQVPVRALALLVLMLASTFPTVFGQSNNPYKSLVTSVNAPVSETVSGLGLSLNLISPAPKHGDVAVVLLSPGGSGNPYVYEVRYTPDAGFTGLDTFLLELNHIGSAPYLIYRAYKVAVYPSLMTAKEDYGVTTTGIPVIIPVLANDNGANAPLPVKAIPLVNNGTASVNSQNEVVFTPTPGFTGIAHLNYVVCDALNTCKTSFVSIGVNNGAPPPAVDSLQITTTKNTSLSVPLIRDGYSLFQAPGNGTVEVQNGMMFRYTPHANFTGSDQFLLKYSINPAMTATFKLVTVKVLNAAAQNKMAINDRVYTPKGKSITFNVRSNDVGNLLVKNWSVPNGFPGTLSNTSGTGNVTFTPKPGFEGVAIFSYKIGNMFIQEVETATVNIIVGNQNPSSEHFDLTTVQGTPFVVNYKVPFTDFVFNETLSPQHGECDFYPGYTTQIINGQSVSGYNLLIYTPDPGYVGLDDFTLDYCVGANGECQTATITMDVLDIPAIPDPFCVDNCVWPGDINSDGVVNNKDLLPLGYYMGFGGSSRPDASSDWYGQYAEMWNNPQESGLVNLKHVDTDGNGLINSTDTLAISRFYGKQHTLTPYLPAAGKSLPLFLNFLNPGATIGDLVEIEVSLGSTTIPVTDVYGFTFDVTLSPFVVESNFRMEYYQNSWINLNAPSLTLDKNPTQGRLETAFTRTNGQPVSGYGHIGKIQFIIIDIIVGGDPDEKSFYTITLKDPTLLSSNGEIISAEGFTMQIPLPSERSQEKKVLDKQFFVYPNPASDMISVHLNGNDTFESLTIFDAGGREIYHTGDGQWEHFDLNVSDWANGFYFATARTTTGNVVKKFQVFR